MALEQSALLGLVESLSTADEGMLMRRLLMIMLQLIAAWKAQRDQGVQEALARPAPWPVDFFDHDTRWRPETSNTPQSKNL